MGEQTVSLKVNMNGKSLLIAYLLWWFLGWAGVHRFYLGRTGSGLGQLILFAIGVVTAMFFVGYFLLAAWAVWWLLDAFFVYQITKEENEKRGINVSTISITKTASPGDEIEQLEKLHALYEKGVITREQYEAKKSKLV